MGAWGVESCSNDSTMDCLCDYCEDTNSPTQSEADKCLKNEFNVEYSSTSLGLVIWFLNKGLSVGEDYLNRCIEYANTEYNSDNKDEWFDFEARKDMLKLEKKILTSALENNGKATKRFKKPVGDILGGVLSIDDLKNKENEIVDANVTGQLYK